jgi:plastocyanin
MNLARIAAAGAAILLLGVAAAGCGGDDDDNGGNNGADEARPTSTRAASGAATRPPGGGGGTSVSVTARDFSFTPAEFSVSKTSDTTIELKNEGSAPHTFTLYRDEEFTDAIDGASTDRVSGGESDSFTLKASDIGDADDLYFRCEVHPSQMQGEITFE